MSILFMMATLLWLTINTPFIYNAKQVQKNEVQKQSHQTEDTDLPSTEEKNESNASVSEYLHDQHLLEYDFTIFTKLYKRYPSQIYYEHFPELLSPPPEA